MQMKHAVLLNIKTLTSQACELLTGKGKFEEKKRFVNMFVLNNLTTIFKHHMNTVKAGSAVAFLYSINSCLLDVMLK